jgi:4-amino-4-deoxy-L-arabinose transferase-like glycosyltransferase
MREIILDPRPMAKSPMTLPSGFRQGTFILVLYLFTLFVLFHDLGDTALFEPDEGRNAEVAREILLTQDWLTPHYNFIPRPNKSVFYYCLVALSYKLFGVSEWSARLPSAVAALACVVLTSSFAFTMFGFWEALWSGLILVTGVEFFILSRTVISEMTLAFFITLSLCAFQWGRTTDRGKIKKGFYLLMYVSMGVATLVKGPIGMILPGVVIFFYLFHTRKWRLLKEMNLVLGIPLLLFIAGSWYVWAETRHLRELRYFLLEDNVLRFLTPRFHRSQPWYYLFSVLLIGFLPWTLLLAFIVENLWKRPVNDISLFLVTWVVLPLFFFSFSDSKFPHYILPVYPPLSVLAGQSLCHILRDPSGKTSWALSLPRLTLAAALVIVVLALLWPDVLPDHIREPIRQFAPIIPFFLLWIILIIFIVFAFTDWMGVWKKPGALYLSYWLGFVMVFLIAHRVMVTFSETRSSRELAEKTARFICAEDQIVVYHTYLSSLPFYLRVDRPLWVVWSGKEDRVMGSTYVGEKPPGSEGGERKVLFTDEEFLKLWRESRGRLLVFAHAKDVNRLNERGMARIKTIVQSGDVVLVANR